jgi:integrase
MAFLIRRARTRNLTAVWYKDGRQVRRSTGTTDKRKAQKMADAWESIDHRILSSRRLLEVAAELRGKDARMTPREYFAAWRATHELEWMPATQTFYEDVERDFLAFLGPRAGEPMNRIQQEDIIAYRTDLAGRVAPKTANNKLKAVRTVFAAAFREQLIPGNPTDDVALLPEGDKVKEAFTDEQIRALLAAATGEWRGLILLGLYTGQRLGDVARMTWGQIDLERKAIRLVTSKIGLHLWIPMKEGGPLLSYLRELTPGAGPIHPRAAKAATEKIVDGKKKRGKTGGLSNQFAEIMVRAGLREKTTHKGTGKGRTGKRNRYALSYHSLRHTATTNLYEAGVPAAVVKALIGHKSDDMSAHYTHIGEQALRDAAAKMRDVTAPGPSGQPHSDA